MFSFKREKKNPLCFIVFTRVSDNVMHRNKTKKLSSNTAV